MVDKIKSMLCALIDVFNKGESHQILFKLFRKKYLFRKKVCQKKVCQKKGGYGGNPPKNKTKKNKNFVSYFDSLERVLG